MPCLAFAVFLMPPGGTSMPCRKSDAVITGAFVMLRMSLSTLGRRATRHQKPALPQTGTGRLRGGKQRAWRRRTRAESFVRGWAVLACVPAYGAFVARPFALFTYLGLYPQRASHCEGKLWHLLQAKKTARVVCWCATRDISGLLYKHS